MIKLGTVLYCTLGAIMIVLSSAAGFTMLAMATHKIWCSACK